MMFNLFLSVSYVRDEAVLVEQQQQQRTDWCADELVVLLVQLPAQTQEKYVCKGRPFCSQINFSNAL